MNQGLRRLLMAAILLLPTQWLRGASVLDFPRLSLDPGVITGIAIVNPNPTEALVTLTAFRSDGSVLATRELSIAAGRQISRVLTELFRDEADLGSGGWLQAFSMSSNLTGFFLVLNATGTEFDGAALPPRSNFIVFNQIRVGEGTSTELNLVNTGGERTQVELTLVRDSEEPLISRLELAARGSARLDAGELFGVNQLPADAYVTAEASQDLVGFELVRAVGADLQGLNARNANEVLNTLYFTQVSVLGPFETRLGLVNRSDRAIIVTATAHRPDGTLFDQVQANPVNLGLAPGESVNRDLVELFGFQGDDPLEGWLEVTSTSPALHGHLELRGPATGAAATLTPLAQGALRLTFSHLATSLGFFTGVALLNPATLPADVQLAVQSASGELLGSYNTVLLPGRRISNLITDLIPEADGQAGGLIFVRSNVPLFSSALFGNLAGTVLSNIPGQSVPESFRPDAALPSLEVVPGLAILQTAGAQAFQTDPAAGAVEWQVGGITGGNAQLGQITGAGLYTAPAMVPDALPVVVTAASDSRTAAGSVDIVSPEVIAQGLGLVQSLAFLNSVQRLYTAELGAVGAAAGIEPPEGTRTQEERSAPTGSPGSALFEMGADGGRRLLTDLGNEEVPKMIPFPARDGTEYLLAAARLSGRVLRVHPITGAIRVVADDLDSPSALLLDPVTENLLVAEATQITSVPLRQLESDLNPASRLGDGVAQDEFPRALLAPLTGISGLAVSACTGRLYLSQRDSGRILEFERETGAVNVILEGLSAPGQLTGFYRAGVSCPDSFHLLIVEEGADQVTLLVPSTGEVISPWIADVELNDIVLIPEDSPFPGRVVYNDAEGDGDVLLTIDLPGLYNNGPLNPPQLLLLPFSASPPGPDLSVSQSTTRAGTAAAVSVFYRPGEPDGLPGGPDETNILVFTLDYDESRLRFDPADSNSDGIPDSILPNTPGEFTVFVRFDPEATDGELGIAVLPPSGVTPTLPEDSLMTISFQVLPSNPGTAPIRFIQSSPPQAVDTEGRSFPFDEVSGGLVSVTP